MSKLPNQANKIVGGRLLPTHSGDLKPLTIRCGGEYKKSFPLNFRKKVDFSKGIRALIDDQTNLTLPNLIDHDTLRLPAAG